jgi:N-acetyl-S-(2-succino)cysteine monooxygenase
MSKKQLHLGVALHGVGHGIAWRHPEHISFTAFESFVQLAQTAERGLLDFVFFAEGLMVREHQGKFFGPIINGRPDSIALLPALAAVTEHIGLAATISTTYNQPYELARQLAGIDHVSGGRVAWNVVTSFSNSVAKDSGGDGIALNFSKDKHLDHATRYDRAREFVALIKQLWDSWEDEAYEEGELKRAALHDLQHTGKWFRVQGVLDTPRPPQGHPVIIQAGQSDDGRDLAARIADVIFSPFRDINESKAHYADIKQRMVKYGRSPDQLRVLPGLAVVVAPTVEEAEAKDRYQRSLVFTDQIVRYVLSEPSGYDFATVDLDGPFPEIDISNPKLNGPLLAHWQERAQAEGLTVRQLAESASPRWAIVGTPTQVADHFEHWLEEEASDGFLLTPPVFPHGLNDVVDLLIPELQRRGLFRTAYTGSTLREHLGLERPLSPFVAVAANE